MLGTKRIGLLLLAWLVMGSALQAQIKEYQESAAELSTLYRGKMPQPYPFRFNGTYYLETRTFQQGRVWFNGKVYEDVRLNLDAYAMELEVQPSAKAGSVIPSRGQVAWFTMGDRPFLNLRYLGYTEAPEGYFELVKDGLKPLLLYKKKLLRAAVPAQQQSLINELDGNFDDKVVNYFSNWVAYYTLENGTLKKISGRAFRRALKQPSQADESPLQWENAAWRPLESQPSARLTPKAEIRSGVGLPEGYFEEKRAVDTTVVVYENNALTATYQNKIYTIGVTGTAKGNKATVSGLVREAESGEPLPGVVIYDDKTSTYVRSDARGRYRIQLPLGENLLNFNAESKEDIALKVVLQSDGELDVVMSAKITLLKGAIISAESMQQHRNTIMGVESVSMKTAGKIPSAFGEGDIMKAVLTLPGVKTVGEASGGFNVRGGSADQNLVLFNDNTLYNPSHLFGMFSSFNPDLVDGVELFKSSIPAQYGGRISSVLSVKSKEGDRNRVRGSLGIGLLTSRGHIEGPMGKKTTFIAGARTTYSDWMLRLLPKHSAYAGGSAGFTDANLGLTHHFSDQDALQLFGYFATDRFTFSGDTTFRYTNFNASASFRHKDADGNGFRISAGYDHFTNILGDHSWATGAYDLQTYIRQAFLKAGGQFALGDHSLSAGLDVVGYLLDPGILRHAGEASQIVDKELAREMGLEPALYLSDNWTLSEQFSLDGGIRLSSFLAQNPSKFYIGPEFRLSAKYSPAENLSFKAGFNTLQQYIHLISNTSSVSPMDTWRLSSDRIKPTSGWQAAVGGYWTLLGAGIDFSLDGYYKRSRNGLDYKNGAVLSMNPNLADDLVPVFGRAYGVELMVRKPAGRLSGWVSYSYARSQLREMQDRGASTINHGAWYNAPYDKPHEFKFVGNFALTHRFSVSVNVDYSTGRPVTIPVGRYYYGGQWRLSYSERGGYRIPDYFRVDAALNIDPGHYLKAFAHASVTIGVYNVTGRKNPYSIFFRTTPGGYVNGYMLSVFASQIPYINLNILF